MRILTILLVLISFQATAETYKVLTWNIFMLPTWTRKVKQTQRLAPLSSWLSESRYDFVMFQEAFTKDSYNELVKAMKEHYPYNTGRPFKKWYRITNSGLVIFSRYPLENTKIYLYYGMGHADRFSSKGFLITTATLPNGQKVHLGNTHLQAKKGEKYTAIRKKQLNKIKKYIFGKEKNPDYPFIIGGDFNIDMYKSPEAPFLFETMNTLPLKTKKPEGELIYSSDFASNDLIRAISPGDDKQKFIDYIFAYDGNQAKVEMKELKILDVEGKYVLKKKPGQHNLSDHHAVQAIIEIN